MEQEPLNGIKLGLISLQHSNLSFLFLSLFRRRLLLGIFELNIRHQSYPPLPPFSPSCPQISQRDKSAPRPSPLEESTFSTSPLLKQNTQTITSPRCSRFCHTSKSGSTSRSGHVLGPWGCFPITCVRC